MPLLTRFFLPVFISCFPFFAGAQLWDGLVKIIPTDGQIGGHFGYAISVHNDHAIVGSNFKDSTYGDTGGGYILEEIDNEWVQVAILHPEEVTGADFLGEAVAIYGDIAVLASYRYGNEYLYEGIAYVYEKVDGEWTQTSILKSDSLGPYHSFTQSVTIYNETIVIGEPGREKGMVHVFEKVDGEWTAIQLLSPEDTENADDFGISVALNDDYLAIGDLSNDYDGVLSNGAVHIFEKEGDIWVETDFLVASDFAEGDHFGEVIAMDDDYLIVGAPNKYSLGYNTGAAYIFELIDGSTWEQTEILIPSDPLPQSCFGYSVDIADGDAIIGTNYVDAPTDPDDSVGTAYVFQYLGPEPGWEEVKRLRPEDPEAGDEFGYAVAVSDGVAMVGAFRNDDQGKNSGSVYIFGVDRNSSIAENKKESLLIYPNPVTNQILTIQTDIELATINITDAIGKQVLIDYNPNSNTVQLPKLAAGYYFLQVTTTDDQKLSQPIIVH